MPDVVVREITGSPQTMSAEAAIALIRSAPTQYVLDPPNSVSVSSFIAAAILQAYKESVGNPDASYGNLIDALSTAGRVVEPFGYGSISGADERAAVVLTLAASVETGAAAIIDETVHPVASTNPLVGTALAPRKTTFPRGSITIPAGTANWVEILEHIDTLPEQDGDFLFVTFESGSYVFRDRPIKLRVPMIIRCLTANGAVITASFDLDCGGEVIFDRCRHILPLGQQFIFTVVAGRLTIKDFSASLGADGETVGQFMDTGGASFVAFQITGANPVTAGSEDTLAEVNDPDNVSGVYIDCRGVYSGTGLAAVMARYQTYFWAAATGARQWTILGDTNPVGTDFTDLISFEGCNGYLSNVVIWGDGNNGTTQRVRGVLIDRDGGVRVSCTSTRTVEAVQVSRTIIKDCLIGISVRATGSIDVAGGSSIPVQFLRNGKAMERISGGIIGANMSGLHVTFGTGADANTEAISDGNVSEIMLAGAGRRQPNVQTANYIAGLRDLGAEVYMNVAGANTFTIPPHVDVSIPLGYELCVVQIGAGTTTITAGAGVTINSKGGLVAISGQYGRVWARQRVSNTWVLSGDLA